MLFKDCSIATVFPVPLKPEIASILPMLGFNRYDFITFVISLSLQSMLI